MKSNILQIQNFLLQITIKKNIDNRTVIIEQLFLARKRHALL